MTPMATILLSLPAALLFIVCVCGVALLRPPAPPTGARRCGGEELSKRRIRKYKPFGCEEAQEYE